jgi:predicted nucleic acid-binding protein
MSGDSAIFVDSNVFLYAVDDRNPDKRRLARRWLERLWTSGLGRLSWQVINEFYANAIRLGATQQEARRHVELMSQWQPAAYGSGILHRAWHWIDASQVSYWDALILSSAESMHCRWLISEDFQAGHSFGDLTALNPFQTSPESILGLTPPPPARKS